MGKDGRRVARTCWALAGALAAALLSACDAGHLGNPLTLPARAAAAAVSNAAYDERRGRVKAVLTEIGPGRLAAEQARRDAFFKKVWDDLVAFRESYDLWEANAFLPRGRAQQ